MAEPDSEEAPASETCDCPRLDPDDWHEVESDWADITFLRASVPSVLGVPTAFASVKLELVKKALAEGFAVPDDPMVLLGAGQFRRPILLEVEDPPEEARDMVRPGGVAFSHLAPAPLGAMKARMKDLKQAGRGRYGRDPDDIWAWYLTCRTCSRERNFETLLVGHYKHP
ncbi:MAG: hydrolase [Dehalococcoidia bacterium]